jgi:CelD/BcsL family acetyltransferase involved in cellulose biosynthesis
MHAATPAMSVLSAKEFSREPIRPVSLHEVDPIRDPRWARLVEKHGSASCFHSPNWLTALKNVYGYQPVAITTCPPEAPLTNGLVLCRIQSWLTGSRLVSLPFSDHCEPLAGSREDLNDLLFHLRRKVDAENWKYVEVRPVSIELEPGTKFSKHLSYCFHRLDLNRDLAEIFRHLHKDCVQRKIRRAEREQLKYEEGNSDILLQKFYRLMVITRRRQSLPPQPLAWFRGLVAAFGSSLKIRVVSAGETPVASILTIRHKTTMTYKYGCSDADLNKLGGTAFLFWKTIEDAKASGCDELDLGRSDADNLGLIAFKNRLGACATSLTYWTYPQQPAVDQKLWNNKLVQRATSLAPRAVLETVGKLLYKHIG